MVLLDFQKDCYVNRCDFNFANTSYCWCSMTECVDRYCRYRTNSAAVMSGT